MPSRRTVCLVVGLVIGATAGCAQSGEGQTGATSLPPSTGISSSTTSQTTSTTTATSTDTDTSTDTSTDSGADSSTPPVITITGLPKLLTLADIFDPGKWREGSFAPASTGKDQSALALEVDCSFPDRGEMELRFARASGFLQVTIGQALASESSKGQLQITIYSDGRQVAVEKVRFKESKQMKVELSGVGALTIAAKPSDETLQKGCDNKTMTALLTDLSVGS